MPRYAGKNLKVYMSKDGNSEAEPVLRVSQWTNSGSVDFHEVTADGDTSKTYVAGLPDAGGNINRFWDDEDDVVPAAIAATKNDDPVKLYLYRSMQAATKYIYGTAWVSKSDDVGINSAITENIEWRPASAMVENT